MSYKLKSLEKIDENKVKLDLEISNSYFRKSLDKAYKNISRSARIPGFRKGKVPYQIIDINFGKEYVLNEAASISISELYPKIITDASLKPIDYPKISITQLDENLPLAFEITVDVEPEPELPEYKGIEVKSISTEVTEDELNRYIDTIRARYAMLEPVDEDKGVEKGDYVVMDFDGRVEGKEFEGGSVQDYVLEVGSGVLLSELENSLLGMKRGGEKRVTFKLPSDFENESLAGKEAEYRILVKEIKRKVIPELNQEFIENLGDYKDVNEFRNYIKDTLVKYKERFRRNFIATQILNYLVENTKLDIPPVMVENRVKQIKREMEEAIQERNVTRENYLKAIGMSEGELEERIKEDALRDIKEYLIITALEERERENIEPTEEEIEKEKEIVFSSLKSDEEKARVKELFEDSEQVQDFVSSIRRRKLIDFLIENARIIEEG
ncbi:MAG: trigger factor, partial [Actinobacteria bacterium]|nr:trigger factor [Actinomycetota bacterium]